MLNMPTKTHTFIRTNHAQKLTKPTPGEEWGWVAGGETNEILNTETFKIKHNSTELER